jgi:hypothetical protein
MSTRFFTCDKFPNTHISFNENGLVLYVTLNIPLKLKKYLGSNVFKGKKHWVYSLKKEIQLPNQLKMYDTYNELMKRAMINIRSAKISALSDQIIELNSK